MSLHLSLRYISLSSAQHSSSYPSVPFLVSYTLFPAIPLKIPSACPRIYKDPPVYTPLICPAPPSKVRHANVILLKDKQGKAMPDKQPQQPQHSLQARNLDR